MLERRGIGTALVDAKHRGDQSVHLALGVCFFLFIVPYMFYVPSQSFNFYLALSNEVHFLYSFMISLFGLFAYFIGGKFKVYPGNTNDWTVSPLFVQRFFVVFLGLSFSVYVFQFLSTFQAAIAGDFLGARRIFSIPGIGVMLRSPMIILPFLFYNRLYPRSRSALLWIFFVFCIYRAFAMSERLAVIEAAVTFWACMFLAGRPPTLRSVVIFASLIAVFFAVVQAVRFDALIKLDYSARDSGFIPVTTAYYADVMNKFYLICLGYIEYPVQFYSESVGSLSGRSTFGQNSMNLYLTFQAPNTSYISSALNNPGGLASIASDFGYFSPLFFFLYFFIFGRIIKLCRVNLLCAMLLPITIVSILEFPRFVYFYESNCITLILISVLLSSLSRAATRMSSSRLSPGKRGGNGVMP